jgi:DNA-binding response OmpR family regulator
VTASPGSPLVLIIDDDLGFLMWLGEVFTELGCQTVPALHCRQARSLAKRLKMAITTLVVNPELPGAELMVKALAEANPGVQVVVLIPASAAHPNESGIEAQASLKRPSPWEPISRSEWVARVRKVLR